MKYQIKAGEIKGEVEKLSEVKAVAGFFKTAGVAVEVTQNSTVDLRSRDEKKAARIAKLEQGVTLAIETKDNAKIKRAKEMLAKAKAAK